MDVRRLKPLTRIITTTKRYSKYRLYIFDGSIGAYGTVCSCVELDIKGK